jgi:hypothetical protein
MTEHRQARQVSRSEPKASEVHQVGDEPRPPRLLEPARPHLPALRAAGEAVRVPGEPAHGSARQRRHRAREARDRGRRGKPVTTIHGVPGEEDALRELAAR